MDSLLIKQLEIGKSKPKICVSVTGKTSEEILLQAQKVVDSNIHILEWRIDFYEEINSNSQVRETIEKLKAIVGEMPILFTIRSKDEGGQFSYCEERYAQLLSLAIKSRHIDIIDVEIEKLSPLLREVCDFGRSNEVFLMASYHNFEKTPTKDFLKKKLKSMNDEKFNLAKIALMPQRKKDVIRLMEVAIEAEEFMEIPQVTISMGEMGKISRVAGEFINSAITFGALEECSAPGQVEVHRLKEVLESIHNL